MVTDLAELRSQLQQLNLTANEGTSCILQQWITGSPEQHIFLDGFFSKAREYSGVFARRRLRMYPQFFGNSTFMKSIDLDEVASASKALQQLFVSTGFYGIFSAEFKYDKHDEQFKLLEVNVRPWWYTEFASQNGMNAPLLSYQEALKLKPTAFAVRRGSSCIHPYYDFFALGGLRNLLSLGGVRWLYQLSVSSNPWFAWDDPAPALHQGWKTLLEIIARR